MITGKFKYGSEVVPMELGYRLAHGKMLDLGLDILSVGREDSIMEVIKTVMIDEATMLAIWFYYIQEAGLEDNFEDALEVLDEDPQGLEPFKKAFWDMVVGFTPIALQDTLRRLWREVQKELKSATDKTSTTSISDSQPEQD